MHAIVELPRAHKERDSADRLRRFENDAKRLGNSISGKGSCAPNPLCGTIAQLR